MDVSNVPWQVALPLGIILWGLVTGGVIHILKKGSTK